MQYKRCMDTWFHLREHVIEFLKPTLDIDLCNVVVLKRALEVDDDIDRIDVARRVRKTECVLVQNMASDGHHIRFRVPDRLVPLDTK